MSVLTYQADIQTRFCKGVPGWIRHWDIEVNVWQIIWNFSFIYHVVHLSRCHVAGRSKTSLYGDFIVPIERGFGTPCSHRRNPYLDVTVDELTNNDTLHVCAAKHNWSGWWKSHVAHSDHCARCHHSVFDDASHWSKLRMKSLLARRSFSNGGVARIQRFEGMAKLVWASERSEQFLFSWLKISPEIVTELCGFRKWAATFVSEPACRPRSFSFLRSWYVTRLDQPWDQPPFTYLLLVHFV